MNQEHQNKENESEQNIGGKKSKKSYAELKGEIHFIKELTREIIESISKINDYYKFFMKLSRRKQVNNITFFMNKLDNSENFIMRNYKRVSRQAIESKNLALLSQHRDALNTYRQMFNEFLRIHGEIYGELYQIYNNNEHLLPRKERNLSVKVCINDNCYCGNKCGLIFSNLSKVCSYCGEPLVKWEFYGLDVRGIEESIEQRKKQIADTGIIEKLRSMKSNYYYSRNSFLTFTSIVVVLLAIYLMAWAIHFDDPPCAIMSILIFMSGILSKCIYALALIKLEIRIKWLKFKIKKMFQRVT